MARKWKTDEAVSEFNISGETEGRWQLITVAHILSLFLFLCFPIHDNTANHVTVRVVVGNRSGGVFCFACNDNLCFFSVSQCAELLEDKYVAAGDACITALTELPPMNAIIK